MDNTNKIEIKIELANYDEIIEKLEYIKKILNELGETKIQIEVE